MLPWINEENEKETITKIKNTDAKKQVIFGHLELNGFKVNNYVNMDHGLDSDCLIGLKKYSQDTFTPDQTMVRYTILVIRTRCFGLMCWIKVDSQSSTLTL